MYILHLTMNHLIDIREMREIIVDPTQLVLREPSQPSKKQLQTLITNQHIVFGKYE